MSRFHLRYAQAASCVVPLIASTLIGLNLSRWLAAAGHRSPPGPGGGAALSIDIPRDPRSAVTDVGGYMRPKRKSGFQLEDWNRKRSFAPSTRSLKRGPRPPDPVARPGPEPRLRRTRLAPALDLHRRRSDIERSFDGTACVVDGPTPSSPARACSPRRQRQGRRGFLL